LKEIWQANDLNVDEVRASDDVQSMPSTKGELKVEVLTPKDPRYVPKNAAFYLHDTGRSTNTKHRAPFGDDDKDEGTIAKKQDHFHPTKNGK